MALREASHVPASRGARFSVSFTISSIDTTNAIWDADPASDSGEDTRMRSINKTFLEQMKFRCFVNKAMWIRSMGGGKHREDP